MARPVGTTENPATLVKRELKEGLKQQGEVRKIIQRQIEEIQKLLETKDLSLETRIGLLKELAGVSEQITKGIGSIAKWVMPAAGEDEEKTKNHAASIEEVLREMVGRTG